MGGEFFSLVFRHRGGGGCISSSAKDTKYAVASDSPAPVDKPKENGKKEKRPEDIVLPNGEDGEAGDGDSPSKPRVKWHDEVDVSDDESTTSDENEEKEKKEKQRRKSEDTRAKTQLRKPSMMSTPIDAKKSLHSNALSFEEKVLHISTNALEIVGKNFGISSGKTLTSMKKMNGAAAIVDVAGFTALTQRLSDMHGFRGAEILQNVLCGFFDEVISRVVEYGGDVVHFLGDAVLVAFLSPENKAEEASLRAARCCLSLLELNGWTHEEADVSLQLHIGVSSGSINHFAVDTGSRCFYSVAGKPIDMLGPALSCASAGEIVASSDVWEYCSEFFEGTPVEHNDKGHVRLLGCKDDIDEGYNKIVKKKDWVRRREVWVDLCVNSGDTISKFLSPPAIQGNLAEFRVCTILMMTIPDVDYAKPTVLDQVSNILNVVHDTTSKYFGKLMKFVDDDKGTSVFVVFGLPGTTSENNPSQALHCAFRLKEEAAKWKEITGSVCIGVASGRVFCGPLGGRQRHEYTTLGTRVNMAARMMSASKGEILCDTPTYKAAKRSIAFTRVSHKLKGIPESLKVFRADSILQELDLTQEQEEQKHKGSKSVDSSSTFRSLSSMYGRMQELNLLGRIVDDMIIALEAEEKSEEKRGEDEEHKVTSLVVIQGEAGIGKSRLVQRFTSMLVQRIPGISLFSGIGSELSRGRQYDAWRSPLMQLLRAISPSQSPTTEELVQALKSRVPEEHRESVQLLSPIFDIFGQVATGEHSDILIGSKKHAAEEMVIAFLENVIKEKNMKRLALVLEDCHLMDSASWDLLYIAKAKLQPHLFLVLTMRPGTVDNPLNTDVESYEDFAQDAENILLENLPRHAVEAMLSNMFREISGAASIIPEMVDRARGNPFYITELARAFLESAKENAGCDASTAFANMAVPESIQASLASRVDSLFPSQIALLRVAAVLGEQFDSGVLEAIMAWDDNLRATRDVIDIDLMELEDRGLIEEGKAMEPSKPQKMGSLTEASLNGHRDSNFAKSGSLSGNGLQGLKWDKEDKEGGDEDNDRHSSGDAAVMRGTGMMVLPNLVKDAVYTSMSGGYRASLHGLCAKYYQYLMKTDTSAKKAFDFHMERS